MDRRRRLRRDAEFRRVRQQGRCWSADVLVLCALKTDAPITRFGFVVSKRLGGAVVRNRVKRRLREAARHLAPSLAPGYDVVVIARGAVTTRSFAELAGTLAALARRARLHRPSVTLAAPPAAAPDATHEGQPGSQER